MDEQGFNFSSPSERREAKSFEPPPWEREAFDELARKKAEEAEAPASPAVAETAATEAVAGRDPRAAVLAGLPEVIPEAQPQPAQPTVTPAPSSAEPAEDAPAKPAVDQARLIEMMAGLREEEEPVTKTFRPIGLFAAFVTGLIGVVLLFWGVIQMVVSGAKDAPPAATVGGAILAIFGALFVALAFWAGARTLRQRGSH